MATTIASRKQKGRIGQQLTVRMLLSAFPDLTERDVVSQPMGVPNEDLRLSEAAFKRIPYAIEVKNQEKLALWDALKQSEDPKRKGTPLLVFKRNRSDIYCAVKFQHFVDLLKKIAGLEASIDHLNDTLKSVHGV